MSNCCGGTVKLRIVRPLSSVPKARPKPKAAAEGLACSFCQKDRQARKRSAARSMSDRHRIADWVVPSVKADDSVAEQYLRGFSALCVGYRWGIQGMGQYLKWLPYADGLRSVRLPHAHKSFQQSVAQA